MKLGFCFNVLHGGNGVARELDFDAPETIDGIQKALESLGHQVIRIEADEDIFTKLSEQKGKIDAVFNIAEGLHGDARESWVPMACEILKIPYTHSSPTVLALCLDKRLCKLAVAGLGFNVPGENKLPAIIKPVCEGSSMGIFDANVVEDQHELEIQLAKLRMEGLNADLLIEEFIDGREFTVGILGNGAELTVLPIIEQRFDILPEGYKKIAGYELKWISEVNIKKSSDAYICPAILDKDKQQEIEETAKKIYKGLGIRDCGRIDFRMDKNNKLYFLEVNPLPGLILDENIVSYLPAAARTDGLDGPALIKRILQRVETAKKD